jgi:hypothetical protein
MLLFMRKYGIGIFVGGICVVILAGLFIFVQKDNHHVLAPEKNDYLEDSSVREDKDNEGRQSNSPSIANRESISYNNVRVEVFIDREKGSSVEAKKETDIILAFQGTNMNDVVGLKTASEMPARIRGILTKENNDRFTIVSVAYPQENILLGDEIQYAEAALLWAREEASDYLDIQVRKIYLFGHSRGGYLVTRLNTLHATDGVIANGPGPIDLAYRCKQEYSPKVRVSEEDDDTNKVCRALDTVYGNSKDNPVPYTQRSMITFADGLLSPELFIQGLEDKKIQMHLWSIFSEKIAQCADCAPYKIINIENAGHRAVYESKIGRDAVNEFFDEKQEKF